MNTKIFQQQSILKQSEIKSNIFIVSRQPSKAGKSFFLIYLEKPEKSAVAAIKNWKRCIFKNFEIETFFHLI